MARSHHRRFGAIMIFAVIFAVSAFFASCAKETPHTESDDGQLSETYISTLSAETTVAAATSAVQTSFTKTQEEDVLTDSTSSESTPEPSFETKKSATIEKIPRETEYVYSDDEYEDVSYVLKYGRDGLLQITKTGYYSDGKLFIEDSEEKILSEPENKKILVGTKPIISTDHITERESVPFETETVTDGDMYEDERITEREGVCGVVLRVYEVTYERGEEVSRKLISEEKTPAVSEIIKTGTKPVFTYETIKKNENTVKYSVKYVYDGNIYEGERRTKTHGADGYTVNTYKITYERGKEIKREVISSETVAPIDEVIAIGTKKKEETFALPFRTAAQGGADYRVTQYYGGSNSHGGIDFGVYYGAPITASMSGTVVYACNDGYFSSSDLRWTYGTYVVIDHGNGYRTYYAHLKSKTVSAGDKVVQGQVIGYSGNTGRVSPAPTASNPYAGTHLHFEIRKYSQGSYVKVDPKKYLPRLN